MHNPALDPCFPGWLPLASRKRFAPYFDFANGRYFYNGRLWRSSEDASALLAALSGSETRGSAAARTTATGLLAQATSNALRFDYDPVSFAAKGILLEPAATNLITFSEQFDNAAWTKTSCTVTANAATAPDGNVTADKLVEGSGTVSPNVNTASTSGSSVPIVASAFVKAAGRGFAFLTPDGGNGILFDLTSGAIAASFGSVTSSFAIAYPNAWWRLGVVLTNTVRQLFVGPKATGALTSYTGDGSSGIFLWGAQVEVASSVTSYVPTTSGSASRSADALAMTLPAGVASALYTFDDNSTQSASVSAGGFTVPTNLNRPTIKSLAIY